MLTSLDYLDVVPYGYQETLVERLFTQIQARGYLTTPQQLIMKAVDGGDGIFPPPGASEVSASCLDELDRNMAKLLGVLPTGGGKTPAMLLLAEHLIRHAEDEAIGVVFFILAPYSLSMQAKEKFQEYGVPSSRLFTVQEAISEAGDGPLPSGSYVFAGYEVFNTDKKLVNADNELGLSLAAVCRATRMADLRLVTLADEAHVHMLGSANHKAVLRHIAPDIRIGFTATPGKLVDRIAPDAANRFYITAEDVKKEKVIVQRTYVNFGNDALQQRFDALVSEQPKKVRERLAEMDLRGEQRAFHIFCAVVTRNDHQKLAADTGAFKEGMVNLASAIQLPFLLPNAGKKSEMGMDTDEGMYTRAPAEARSDDAVTDQGREDALYVLEHLFGWTVENGLVAIYTAAEKVNMERFGQNDGKAKAIIFKAALALGFDAPRIHTMALLREAKSPSFAIQVVGRATRMPERKYYEDESLNCAYVYTEYAAMKAVIGDSNGEVVQVSEFSRTPVGDSIAEKLSGCTMTTYYNKRGSQNDVKTDTDGYRIFARGLESQLGRTPVWEGGLSELLEAGFEKRFLTTQGYQSAAFERIDIDRPEDITRAARDGEMKATSGSLLRGWTTNTREAFVLNFERSRGHLEQGFKDFASRLGVPTEKLFRLVLGSETNRAVYRKLIEAGVKAVFGDGSGAEFTVHETPEPWVLPQMHRVRGESVYASKYMYEAAPAVMDSDPEGYMKDIILRLRDSGLNVVGFYKAEGRGLESIGLNYRMDGATEERLFYPDWMVFVEKDGDIHWLIWETKAYSENLRKKPVPEEVAAKSARLTSFVEDYATAFEAKGVFVHGAMLNLDKHKPSAASLGGVRVIGQDVDIIEWCRQEGLLS